MNIDTMPAGREMDALVAEKVMGVTEIFKSDFHGDPMVRDYDGEAVPIRSYSTDIAAAWEVVEKLRGRDCSIYVGSSMNVVGAPWEVRWIDTPHHPPTYMASAETAPLAICRAALKAVGL